MRYRAPSPDALVSVEMDAFTAVFHRRSGITHLLASPAPEILAALGDEALDLPALMSRLAESYDLTEAEPQRAALAARVDELLAAGLLSPA